MTRDVSQIATAAESTGGAAARQAARRGAAGLEAILATLTGCRVALVAFPDEEAARVAALLDRHEAFVRTLHPNDVVPGATRLQRFELVMLRLPDHGAVPGWAPEDVAAANERPLVFIGGAAALGAVGPTLCRSGHDFVATPFDDTTLLLRACHVIRASTTNLLPVAAGVGSSGAGFPAAAGSVRLSTSPAPIATGPLRVLVADDDATVIALLSATLSNYGVECHAASDGQEALDLARQLRPDALVLDVNMPHLDGFAVLAAVRNDPVLRETPVLMLSARHQEADVLRGFGLGADDYVSKPFNPMELAVRLKRMLGRP
jgi:CheY-like chemotaxis protein